MVQNQKQVKELNAHVVGTILLGRMGNPDDITKAVSFLVSDDSSLVTIGSNLTNSFHVMAPTGFFNYSLDNGKP